MENFDAVRGVDVVGDGNCLIVGDALKIENLYVATVSGRALEPDLNDVAVDCGCDDVAFLGFLHV